VTSLRGVVLEKALVTAAKRRLVCVPLVVLSTEARDAIAETLNNFPHNQYPVLEGGLGPPRLTMAGETIKTRLHHCIRCLVHICGNHFRALERVWEWCGTFGTCSDPIEFLNSTNVIPSPRARQRRIDRFPARMSQCGCDTEAPQVL
jgi:hypothetical protein